MVQNPKGNSNLKRNWYKLRSRTRTSVQNFCLLAAEAKSAENRSTPSSSLQRTSGKVACPPAGVAAAGGRAGDVGPADLGQAPRSLRQGRCAQHAVARGRCKLARSGAGVERRWWQRPMTRLQRLVFCIMRQGRCAAHASRALMCARSEHETGRASSKRLRRPMTRLQRLVFCITRQGRCAEHASRALMCARSEHETGRASSKRLRRPMTRLQLSLIHI